MTQSLPVSRVVNVSVSLTETGASSQSLSDLLVVGTSDVLDPVERYREFANINEVATTFGTESEEYQAALLWFSQVPKPTKLLIGRWFNTDSTGGLRCAPRTSSEQSITAWQAITSGGFKATVDGDPPADFLTFDFSGAANLNAVAGIINLRLDSVGGSSCNWNDELDRFEFNSQTIGAGSSFDFLQAPATGTDISALLGGRSTQSGAYTYEGLDAESALDAVVIFDDLLGQQFYGLQITSAADEDHLEVAAYIEAAAIKHIYGVTTSDTGVLVAATDTDIASLLKDLNLRRTFTQYSGSNPSAVVSALARMLTTDYTGNATVITLKFKQEPGVAAEHLSISQANAAEGKNANLFVAYDNDTNIIEQGVMADGTFLDIVTGTDWLAIELQRTVYNLLYTSTTKIPQTDAGMQLLTTSVAGVCDQAVTNGLLAPGVWNSDGFGTLKQGDFLPQGFYIYSAPVSTQNQALRAQRLAMPIKVAAKLAGAIHSSDIAVVVNQ